MSTSSSSPNTPPTGSTSATVLTAAMVQAGPLVPPIERLKLYSAEEWEAFVAEWVTSLKKEYPFVERIGGAGDRGRDVCAYTNEPPIGCPWDNFQCKHYDHALTPGDIWLELGKLCVYTFREDFTVPRAYHFVAPLGVGTELARLLKKPKELRAGLIKKWPEKVEPKIEDSKLTGSLQSYVDCFDFGILSYVPPLVLIEGHRKTPYFIARFGGGLPPRPEPDRPPTTITARETRYVSQLLEAYGDCAGCTYGTVSALLAGSIHRRHLDRSRESFYRAESLQAFSRETVPPGTYEQLQDHVHNGVVDISESKHRDGFERVKATVQAARLLPVDSHALYSVVSPDDKAGICHQLANADKLVWVPKDDK